MTGELIAPRYGRLLSDFVIGATYPHPWEVTLDDGLVALFQASFQDAMPLFASRDFARACQLPERPLHPLLCLNLALSFSVHDVSEQAIAHLAYLDVRFPDAGYVGDTVRARSTVVDVKPSWGDKGVVHVRTVLESGRGAILCAFERKALIRAGRLDARPGTPPFDTPPAPALEDLRTSPSELAGLFEIDSAYPSSFARCFEDFAVGQTFAHGLGHTVGESEHMQLTTLLRNSHPLHFDDLYCQTSSFTKSRVVYGGLVFAWIAALSSRDLVGNALWDLAYRAGAHPAGVAAGDTLYAMSRVLAVEDRGALGAVTFALVGVKNMTSLDAITRHGEDLFQPELGKKAGKIADKVFEIERTTLIRRRPGRR